MSDRPDDPSRREFVAAAMAWAGASTWPTENSAYSAADSAHSAAELTAQQVVDRIRAAVGVPWRETTVDTFKAGDPQTIVTGIATTVMATLPVLRQAAAAGRNLIVTCEPTFYNGNDDPGPRASDPIYLAKKTFIDERRLVVWRFQDHWGARTPNEFATALAEILGWTKYRTPENPQIYAIPSTTIGALAAHVRRRLGVRGPGRRSPGEGGMRIIGPAGMRVRRVFLSPGTTTLQATIDNLPKADLVLSGEPREWEAVEYVFDTVSAGQPKGMIAVGRVISEEPGMRACAAWLRKLVPEVTIDSIAVGDPYWRPPPSQELRLAGTLRSSVRLRGSSGGQDGGQAQVTAQEVIARIQAQLASQGIAWREGGRDTFKAGRPEAPVRGIATTGMSTFDVLRRAAADGKNLVITHEPTFYNDRDLTTTLQSDPVYLAKQRFITEHDLVVWRFHDHAHLMRPDPLIAGSARALGWTQYATPDNPRLYVLPPTTLGALAAAVARRLNDRAIRIAGDPAMKVTRVLLGPGYGMPALTAAVDIVVGGEISEAGGNAEYALDAAAAGQPRGMIVLGHMMSEDHGMQEVAEWLRTFLTGVPVAFVPAGEPFSSVTG